jgi:hypothetical protein
MNVTVASTVVVTDVFKAYTEIYRLAYQFW